jgi:hypothetical protein
VLGEGEGGVEFNPEDPVGLRGVDGGYGRVERDNGNEVFFVTEMRGGCGWIVRGRCLYSIVRR